MNRIASVIFDHLFLLRIPLLAPVWTILMLGWITGATRGAPWTESPGVLLRSSIDGRLWLALLAFSLIVAFIYVVNQIVDVESDRINHKLFLLPEKLVSMRAAWVIAFFCAGAGMTLGWFLGPVVFALFFVSLLVGVAYNLPPLTLKNRPWGGMLANLAGHGVLTYLVGWCAVQPDCSWKGIVTGLVPSLSAGFANAAVYLITTVADVSGDRATGKRTFAVAYGERVTAVMAVVLCAAALAAAWFIPNNRWVMIVPAACSVLFFCRFAVAVHSASAYRTFKWPVFMLTVSVCIFIPTYGLLILATFAGSRWYYRNRFNLEYPSFKSEENERRSQ